MKTIKQFIIDEGIVWTSDLITGGFGNKEDWWFYSTDNNTEVLFDNVSSQNYKILKNQSKYFLSNRNNEYLGSLTLKELSNNVYKIETADSNIKHGFYAMMFTNLLRTSYINEIQSDIKMSSSAISAWIKLKNTPLTIQIYDVGSQSYIEATEENYLKDVRNYFVASLDPVHEQFFQEYDNCIKNQEGFLYEKFSKKHAVVDWKLYGEFYGFLNSEVVTINQINQFKTFEVSLDSHKDIIGEFNNIKELKEAFQEVLELYPYLKEKITFQ